MRRLIVFLVLVFLALPVLAQGPVFPPVSRSLQLGGDSTATTCSDGELLVAASGSLVCSNSASPDYTKVWDGVTSGAEAAFSSEFLVDAGASKAQPQGMVGKVTVEGAGSNSPNAQGVSGEVAYQDDGDGTGGVAAKGVSGAVGSLSANSAIGTAIGVSGRNYTVGGTVTKAVGGQFNAMFVGSATHETDILLGTETVPNGDWSIYSAGTEPSRLAGDLILAGSTVPSTASDTCTTGTVSWGSDYVYVCVATNTWKRAAIATW